MVAEGLVEYSRASDKAILELRKDGQSIDSKVVSPSKKDATMDEKTYYYRRDIGDVKDIITVAVHFDKIYHSSEVDAALVDGIFQISDNPINMNTGINYENMRISSVMPDRIIMDNANSIMLSKNRDQEFMPYFHIKTADQDTTDPDNPLRYYIYKTETVENNEGIVPLAAAKEAIASPIEAKAENYSKESVTEAVPIEKNPIKLTDENITKQSGVEGIFAMIGLIAAVYIVRRNRC